MLILATITAALGIIVGRYADRRGLIAASIAVCVGTAVFLAGRQEGLSYLLYLVLNVTLFQVLAVSMMLFWPAAR